ncbi:hypothetical protein ACFL59_12035 [Planctomycetota bacterium]
MRGFWSCVAVWVAAASLLTSCHTVGTDLTDVAVPVLVGPVHRIGGSPGEKPPGAKVATVRGRAYYTHVRRTEPGARVTERRRNDQVHFLVHQATDWKRDRMAVVNGVAVANRNHVSVGGFLALFVEVSAEIWDPQAKQEDFTTLEDLEQERSRE